MWGIISNEWRFFFRTPALIFVSAGMLLLIILSIGLGILQTQQQSTQAQSAKEHLREQWENIDGMNPHGAAHYGTFVFRPNDLLTSLDEGIGSITGNILRVEGHVQNEMVHSEASQMETISRFGKLKSSLLLQYILPLLLIFLAFHSVSSEKQSGRLKVLILQGASPASIIFAKALSIWLYGVAMLSITILLYALLNLQNLSADLLFRTLMFYFSYSLYYFIITGLTVFFSARWQNSTLALTSMLGIWMLWTIFLPSIFMTTVESLHELPSRNVFQTSMKEDRSQGLDGHNPADERAKELEKSVLEEYGVDSLSQLPINFDGIVMQADEEYGNQVWDKHFGNLREVMAKQKKSYQYMGALSPFISLQNASMGFAASDNHHHQEFLLQVEQYRRVFIKALNDEHAFGGSKTGDWGWQADNEFFVSITDFDYQPVSLVSVLRIYLLDLLLMVCWVIGISWLLIRGTRNMQIV